MSDREPFLWGAIIFLFLSNCGLWLSTNDHYRVGDNQDRDISILQKAVGQMSSCMRWPKNTNNAFCPNPNPEPMQ